ncbi:MAG TPA: carbohydrate ABC transporter permease [Nitrososphaeraceae archaeon]
MILMERTLIYAVIAIYLFITLAPLMWVLSTSFKPNEEAINFPPKFLPERPTLDNYLFVLTDPKLVLSLFNSLMVSLASTGLSVAVCALGGYAFARFEFKGKSLLMTTILGLFMIPLVINIIPLYIMLANVGLLNSLVGLVLTFQIIIIPLNIFLLKNYFETIPKELEEAALIDGCSKIRAFWHIIVPISLPGFVIAAILSFRFSWNEFVLPIVLSNKPDVMVFQVALYQFISLYRIDWGFLTAGINIALIPIVVLMLLFQKRMIKGMTLGAVRG